MSVGARKPTDELGSAAAIRLVAGREVRARLMSKGYRWTTLAFVAVVIVSSIAFKLISGTESTEKIGVLPPAARATASIEAAADAVGVNAEVVPVTDQAAAEEQLRSGDLDVLVTQVTPTLDIVVNEQLGQSLQPMFGALAQQLALVQAVDSLGGDPVTVTQQVSTAAPQVTSLEPTPPVDGGQIAAGYLTGILLFMALMTAGQLVAQGVVEEKSSRVVELLLATLRPWQLMAGKVLGIGLMGLLQVGAVVVAGVGSALALGVVSSSSVDLGATALWALIWFVIGFATYAFVLAALASLVSRQEDVAAVIGPVTAVMAIPYVIGVGIAPWAPDSPLVVILSYIPFASPMLMPIRIALGAVTPTEVAIALVLSLAIIPLLVWFAGRVYSNAVLRSGGRLSLREAMKAR
jgi:ABC-2 type transport system permease protein